MSQRWRFWLFGGYFGDDGDSNREKGGDRAARMVNWKSDLGFEKNPPSSLGIVETQNFECHSQILILIPIN